jgi:protocatechuate 3,4-dioxygenase beta subunit
MEGPTDGRSVRGPGGLSRRQLLGFLGAAGAAALARGGRAAAQAPPDPTAGAPALDCVVTPEQTEGPYFTDERLQRSDLRLDPTTDRLRDGVPLKLRINVQRVDGSTCRPLPGALVDVWQCDAQGVYSDVKDFSGLFDTRGQKFLRGYQMTDRAGAAEFMTIYPGWYPGRTVHIHFKVRLDPAAGRGQELTSQFYFDDALTDLVHARPPYNSRGQRRRRNQGDRIFEAGGSGSRLLLRLRPDEPGYVGAVNVGLEPG